MIAWLMGVTFLGLMGYEESRAFRETPRLPSNDMLLALASRPQNAGAY